MITSDQLKDIKERTDALRQYLSIDEKIMQVEEEQLRTQAPGFWDDAKAAEAQMKKVKSLQVWIDGYKEVKNRTEEVEMAYPHDRAIYKLMWSIFYAQQDSWGKNGKYLTLKELGMEGKGLQLETTLHSYQVRAEVPQEGVVYVLNNEGRFWKEKK